MVTDEMYFDKGMMSYFSLLVFRRSTRFCLVGHLMSHDDWTPVALALMPRFPFAYNTFLDNLTSSL